MRTQPKRTNYTYLNPNHVEGWRMKSLVRLFCCIPDLDIDTVAFKCSFLQFAPGRIFLVFNVRQRGSSDLSVHEGQAEKRINDVKKNRYLTANAAGVLQHENWSLAPTRAGSSSQKAGQQSAQQPVYSLFCKWASNTKKSCSFTSVKVDL